jgi:hypothetical protein
MNAESMSTAPKPFSFILMPFDEAFDDVYKVGIKPACEAAGAYCERVDEQIFNERILDRVYNQIAKADILIADMTGRNANVFYEVGYAHALGKLTILLTQNTDDIPFDLKHFPHIVYGTKIAFLRSELEKRVRFFIENPPGKPSDVKLGLELYTADQSLAGGKAIHKHQVGVRPGPPITVYNATLDTFAPGDFKIGIVTSERFTACTDDNVKSTKLPTGGFIHMLPDFPALFPTGYASYRTYLRSISDKSLKEGEQETVIVRLFTKQGSWDYPITLISTAR